MCVYGCVGVCKCVLYSVCVCVCRGVGKSVCVCAWVCRGVDITGICGGVCMHE